MRRLLLVAAAVLGGVPSLPGGQAGNGEPWSAFPPYRPAAVVSGTIRLWGHGSPKTNFMGRLVSRWISGFHAFQPRIAFDYRMYGTASAIGALYSGAGDLALMGEEIFPYEEKAYEKAMHFPPASVPIATGSLDVRNFDFAQMIFVHWDNPLRRITLQQLDAAFGAERRLGAAHPVRTWGDLGLGGVWAARPVHLYGWSFDNDFWIFLGQAMLGGSHRLNPAIRGYANRPLPDGAIDDAGAQSLRALANDPDGLAISNVRYANPAVRALPVAAKDGGPAVSATASTLISGEYPLTRTIPAVFNQAPGQPIAPAVREFLRYVLSRDGQQALAADGEYLPLSAAAAAAGAARVEETDTATLRIRGDPGMSRLIGLWEESYRRSHPEARFENVLTGSSAGMAGLYTATGDIAFLGRRTTAPETMAFAWVYHYPPLEIPVATGSRDTPGKSPALAVLVNASNPIQGITLAQLDGIFGYERRRGSGRIAAWGDLGLGGDWAGRPIHAYIRDVESGTAAFFRDRVLLGSLKWDWSRVSEVADDRMGGRVAGRDPDALVIGNAAYAAPGGKVVPIAEGAGGPFVLPTDATLLRGAYPLARTVYAYVNAASAGALEPRIAAFLDYIVGPAGQKAAGAEGHFLPLSHPPSFP